MMERSYWPADYVDESMPCGRDVPSAWIERVTPGGALGLAPAWDDTDEASDKRTPLIHGDIVKFAFCDRYDDVDMTVYPDGTFFLHGAVDPAANNFWDIEGWQICGDTPTDFARHYAEEEAMTLQRDGALRIQVGACRWDQENYVFFNGDSDGVGRFELVRDIPADQVNIVGQI